ncbi:MAG: hypothetical protein AAGJ82_01060 [Bacteroidota bacterium]
MAKKNKRKKQPSRIKKEDATWKNAAVEIRTGVGFEDMMKEPSYQTMSLATFHAIIGKDWQTPVADLLQNSSQFS